MNLKMKNVIITTKTVISIPDNAEISQDNKRIKIDNKIYKDIALSVSCYENGECIDAEIMDSIVNIDYIPQNIL